VRNRLLPKTIFLSATTKQFSELYVTNILTSFNVLVAAAREPMRLIYYHVRGVLSPKPRWEKVRMRVYLKSEELIFLFLRVSFNNLTLGNTDFIKKI
jgi:hypothetical protein